MSLCPSCQHNREVIERLTLQLRELEARYWALVATVAEGAALRSPPPVLLQDAAAAELLVLRLQRDSLRDALLKVLDTRNREAKATMCYQNASENFSDSTDEREEHERAMLAASDAEREARVVLWTLRNRA